MKKLLMFFSMALSRFFIYLILISCVSILAFFILRSPSFVFEDTLVSKRNKEILFLIFFFAFFLHCSFGFKHIFEEYLDFSVRNPRKKHLLFIRNLVPFFFILSFVIYFVFTEDKLFSDELFFVFSFSEFYYEQAPFCGVNEPISINN